MPYLKIAKIADFLGIRNEKRVFLSTFKARSVTISQSHRHCFTFISSHFEDNSGSGSGSFPAACVRADEVMIGTLGF